jgi:polyhydroxyalkanoate synthase
MNTRREEPGPAEDEPEDPLPGSDGFAASNDPAPELDHADANYAAQQILGANPLIGVDPGEILDGFRRLAKILLMRPDVVLREQLALARALALIVSGSSKVEPDPKDRRFSHEVWRKSGFYRRLMQGYLAWRASLGNTLDRSSGAGDDLERARFALQLVTEAFAPTNFLVGNPGAAQRIVQTRGKSLYYGLKNFLSDVANNGGMPSQVDERKFHVGKNLAITRGAVVLRTPVFELIQYRAPTPTVHARPLVIVPPQINKFYALDLSPGRSFAEFAAANGVQVFAISWRNPTAVQRDWNLETYLAATLEAIVCAREISGADSVNAMAACAGGFTLATLLGHLAAKRDRRVHSATLLVTVLDTECPTLLGLFASRSGMAAALARSRRQGVLQGRDMARVFSWLRPNDLVWLFVANNWVMGNRPPAFDILYWNSDTTRLPAEFHADLLKIYVSNPLKAANAMTVLGTPVDMRKLDLDTYVVAGITDHITPWQACYQSRDILAAARMQFVLSSSGHIQSIVNPPSNPKASFRTGSDLSLSAEDWLARSTVQSGSWWTHWLAWYGQRGGGTRAAPSQLGSAAHPPGDPAPGRYVFQR